jgi:uncharacterized phage-associated protein
MSTNISGEHFASIVRIQEIFIVTVSTTGPSVTDLQLDAFLLQIQCVNPYIHVLKHICFKNYIEAWNDLVENSKLRKGL